jgi:hypothetical protein
MGKVLDRWHPNLQGWSDSFPRRPSEDWRKVTAAGPTRFAVPRSHRRESCSGPATVSIRPLRSTYTSSAPFTITSVTFLKDPSQKGG